MDERGGALPASEIPRFTRDLFGGRERLTSIGSGYAGGKATGLFTAQRILRSAFPDGEHGGIKVSIPALAVIATDVFDSFIAGNDLADLVNSDPPDERIASAFVRASFPAQVLGDLRSLVATTRAPLAIRSSSLLEDATHEPFAGVYATKMIPNNSPDAAVRFQKLVEAIKFVYASTYFKDAKGYRSLTGRGQDEEKMAVIVQEVVGARHQDRFYPTISGVARSFNYYPTGKARPEEGVVDLALGLGKTIVDGGRSWTYSPAHPNADPPMTTSDLLKQTQTEFFAVNLGKPPSFDPLAEAEYLITAELADAEMDGSLHFVASTYLPENDRIVAGIGRPGPRIVNFAPTIRMPGVPLTKLVRQLLDCCEEELGTGVEIEFAMSLDPLRRDPPRFGFLQVRPILVSTEEVGLSLLDLAGEDVLVASERVLGHGSVTDITDVVYVRPDRFKKEKTRLIAHEIGRLNLALRGEDRRAVLITFGRLGSTDPWLGVPVDWGQISQAKVIVEATLPDMDVELSQGSHFFHNMTSLRISYFNVHHAGRYGIRWEILESAPVVAETEFVRHVRLPSPLTVHVDGRRSMGVILR